MGDGPENQATEPILPDDAAIRLSGFASPMATPLPAPTWRRPLRRLLWETEGFFLNITIELLFWRFLRTHRKLRREVERQMVAEAEIQHGNDSFS